MAKNYIGYHPLITVYSAINPVAHDEFTEAVYGIHYQTIETVAGTLNKTIPTQRSGYNMILLYEDLLAQHILADVHLQIWNPTEEIIKEYRRVFLDSSAILKTWTPNIRFFLLGNSRVKSIEYKVSVGKFQRGFKFSYPQ